MFGKKSSPNGIISVDPLPRAEELALFYKNDYYQKTDNSTYQQEYSPEEIKQKQLRASLIIHALNALRGKSAGTRLLEIGVGEGFVLKSAADAGFSVEGFDFSSYGLRKFHPELEDFLITGDAQVLLEKVKEHSVDVCVLQNVLEHVIDPYELMQKIRGKLTSEGLAAINVPNDFSSLQEAYWKAGKIDREYWFSPPAHLHYFNTENIRNFMSENNFEVVDMFGDFPIEFFIANPSSNYVTSPDLGPGAHTARLQLDLKLAETGMENYHRFYQALSACNMGRNVCVIIRPA